MSDGASEGYRWARESEARQRKIDAFFTAIIAYRSGSEIGETEFTQAFLEFDAIRYAGHIARGRLEKERGKRWETFDGWFKETLDKDRTLEDHWVRQAWAEILALALQFASPNVVERLRDVSPYKDHHVALYVPNGTAHDGRRLEPTLLGDFAQALDAIGGKNGGMVVIIMDADRAVRGFIGSEETKEPERAKLRFLAVRKR
jgi:hypothetical protein